MRKPNLFTYATSELSQDAVLCWLFSWADPKQSREDEALHDYVAHLKRIEEAVASFRSLPISEWSPRAWKGFFMALQDGLGQGGWSYVSNPIRRAHYEILEDDGSYYGEVPGFKGVYANAESLESCR